VIAELEIREAKAEDVESIPRIGHASFSKANEAALQLQQVYVLPQQRRFGIGGRLIEAAARNAREKAADGIWLSVWEEASWAFHCYRENGFEIVGTAGVPPGSSVYTDLLMWRPVDSPG
jgi:ribosomal protein S18 acetylase RimI-like enzyme